MFTKINFSWKSGIRWLLLTLWLLHASSHSADSGSVNYQLGPGDTIRIGVLQNPEMTLETRISQDGSVSYPFLGVVTLGGLDINGAGNKIRKGLVDGGFFRDPQVTIQLLQLRASRVTVLGQVIKPGAFPLESSQSRVSQILAEAGGVSPAGSSRVIVTGVRDGATFRREIDIDALYRQDQPDDDIVLKGGDALYVPRASVFYIYGEINRPGDYRLNSNMTMRQALAAGGGLTLRGTERRLRVVRRNADGKSEKLPVELHDPILPNDVIYVNESIF